MGACSQSPLGERGLAVPLVVTVTYYPCKIRTGILAGSRRDPAVIPVRFWPPGFFFPVGISPGTRQDSRRGVKFQAAKIAPG